MSELPKAAALEEPAAERKSEPTTLADRVRSLRLPERTVQGPSWRPWLSWLVALLLVALVGYLGYRLGKTRSAGAAPEKQESAPALPSASEPAPGKSVLDAGGYVVPVRRVQVSPKVGGEVMELYIEEGQSIKKGQKLAKLDPSRYTFEYLRTQGLAGEAKAAYEKMQAGNRDEEKKQAAAALREAEKIRDQLKDQAERVRRTGSAASAEDLFRIESQLAQAEDKVEQLRQASALMDAGFRKEDIEKARHTWLQAEAQKNNAKYDLDNTDVMAPIDGTILKKYAEVGNTVRPEAFSNGLSASLCDMANLKELEVDVDVSERDLKRIFRKQKCEIRTEAFPETVYQGYVSRLMPEANRSKASVSVRVRIDPIPDKDAILRPEMRARVTFLAPEPSAKHEVLQEDKPR